MIVTQEATVFVVDDDDGLRRSLDWLFRSVRIPVETYASAQEFLSVFDPARPGCLLLDVKMPGLSGLELQRRLQDAGNELPIIILTGHGDVQSTVTAFKAGAFDFIEKPFSDQHLLSRVQQGIEQDRRRRVAQEAHGDIRRRFDLLTRREKEVLGYVVSGYTSRTAAGKLRLVVYTVENHRASVMRKMGVKSVADLVRMVTASGLLERLPKVPPPDSPEMNVE
jgi:two-component system, LuxR family, response regulator FixJ